MSLFFKLSQGAFTRSSFRLQARRAGPWYAGRSVIHFLAPPNLPSPLPTMGPRLVLSLVWPLFWRNEDWFTVAWMPSRLLEAQHYRVRQRLLDSCAVSNVHRLPRSSGLLLYAKDDSKKGTDSSKRPQKSPKNKKRPPKAKRYDSKADDKSKEQRKQEVAKAAAQLRKDRTADSSKEKDKGNLLDVLDPFMAGKKFRQTIDTALTTLSSGGQLPPERRPVYYADDRFLEPGGALFSERNPLFDRMESDGYVPEVLVVGATGAVGRLVVRRLLLDGRFRVRVLVRDLYSKTLNMLGTGVTYCQGDLANIESLEYAVTDVDKIVMCAGAPRPDEVGFADKFGDFVKENLAMEEPVEHRPSLSDLEWDQLESVLELRAKLAEQVDLVGMQNLVRAYQNVRFADYGTSQAAKRSLFKFQDRPEDFNLFSIDEDTDDSDDEIDFDSGATGLDSLTNESKYFDEAKDDRYVPESDDFADGDDQYEGYEDNWYERSHARPEYPKGASVKAQVRWIKNKFEHGVFVGKVPKEIGQLGGKAAVVSSRLRSREDPDKGIDLSNGFAGLVCRVCSDGGTYEAFVRSETYETDGIEYVCEFRTHTKPKQKKQSRNRFATIRLPFDNFKPVQRKRKSPAALISVSSFKGLDVRQIGFRYRSERNKEKSRLEPGELVGFYLALCYIKVYRFQPEAEFVYVSDSRIPPVVHNGMVRHGARELALAPFASVDEDAPISLLDETSLKSLMERKGRSTEETYFKFRGEEILKNSGLSYAIVRVCGFNESPSGEASTIDLTASNEGGLAAVSRDEVAQVCVGALMDPQALNKSFYITKTREKSKDLSREEDMSSKFASLPADKFL